MQHNTRDGGRDKSGQPLKKDEWAVVLDFLSHGHHGMDRALPVAQIIGETYFSLLEVIIREDVNLKVGDRVYIGDGKRDMVKYIRGRIEPHQLTVAAKEELPIIVKDIVEKKPDRFVDFFNKSGPVSTRLHQIELLPGIGRKHLWAILDERKGKPFESFDDLKKRVQLLPNPEKTIIKRVLDELDDKDKYRLFVPRFEKAKKHR
jgi:putative nucleotide binding protein